MQRRATYSTVVPAKAGTHTPCPLDGAVAMGPGSRGLRPLGRDDRLSFEVTP